MSVFVRGAGFEHRDLSSVKSGWPSVPRSVHRRSTLQPLLVRGDVSLGAELPIYMLHATLGVEMKNPLSTWRVPSVQIGKFRDWGDVGVRRRFWSNKVVSPDLLTLRNGPRGCCGRRTGPKRTCEVGQDFRKN